MKRIGDLVTIKDVNIPMKEKYVGKTGFVMDIDKDYEFPYRVRLVEDDYDSSLYAGLWCTIKGGR